MKTAWHKRVTNLPPSNVTVWETRADPKHCCICGVRLPTDAQHELRPTAVNHHCLSYAYCPFCWAAYQEQERYAAIDTSAFYAFARKIVGHCSEGGARGLRIPQIKIR